MVPPNNFFIMDLIETFHISRKWAFFGLLSHAFFPLLIHLLRENFDLECTNIIKHQFVLKSKKKKETHNSMSSTLFIKTVLIMEILFW